MSETSGRKLAWWPFPLTESTLLVAIVLVYLVTGALDPNHSYFTKWDATAIMIIRNASLLGIVALGAAVVIIAGGIDLSAGSMMAGSATACTLVMMFFTTNEVRTDGRIIYDTGLETVSSLGVVCGILAGLAGGILVGSLHTWLITSIRLPPFVATLATLVGLRSFSRAMSNYISTQLWENETEKIAVNTYFFIWLRQNNVWISAITFVVLALVTWVILSRTVLGRHIYAIGGNEEAARLSGIRIENVKWFAYCFSSLCASLAGLFALADSYTCQPDSMAAGFELSAIASAVVGGCSLQGGVGTVLGTALGAVFLRVVIDAVAKLIKAGADVYEGMIVGIIVAVAVTSTQYSTLMQSGRQFFAGWRGTLAIVAISLGASMCAAMGSANFSWAQVLFKLHLGFAKPVISGGALFAAIVFLVVLIALFVVKFREVRRAK